MYWISNGIVHGLKIFILVYWVDSRTYIKSLSVDIQAEYEAEYYVTVDGKLKALY